VPIGNLESKEMFEKNAALFYANKPYESKGFLDFAITSDNKLFIGEKHQCLSQGNQPVIAVGRLKTDEKGFLKSVNSETGHYRPTKPEFEYYNKIFLDLGINTKNTRFIFRDF
jgi:hypothetical protein